MAQPLIALSLDDSTNQNNTITDTNPNIVATFNGEQLYNDVNANGGSAYLNIYVNGKFSGVYTLDLNDAISGSYRISGLSVPSGSDTVTAIISTQAGSATSAPPFSSVLGSTDLSFRDNSLTNVSISGVVVETIAGASTGTTITADEDNNGFKVAGTISGSNAGQVTSVTVQLVQPDGKGVLQVETVTPTGSTFSATFPSGINLPQGGGYTLVITAKDASGNTVTSNTIVSSAVCFLAGTLIQTVRGEVPIEDLRVGELVLTHDGRVEPIFWLGRQTVSQVFGDPLRVLPVRIKAGALGSEQPRVDVLVSPDHALLLSGCLVQAGALINGVTITRQVDMPETFTYYHLELAHHELICVSGLAMETFVDNIDALGFENWRDRGARKVAELPLLRVKSARHLPREIKMQISSRLAGKANAA